MSHTDGDPRILIEHGKHGDSIYWVPTLELLDRAALELLEAKLNYDLVDPTTSIADNKYYQEYVQNAAITDEEIAAAPGGYDLKAKMERERNSARESLRWYEEQHEQVEQAKALIARGNTVIERQGRGRFADKVWRVSEAYEFLDSITDGGEYGSVTLEYPTVAKERG